MSSLRFDYESVPLSVAKFLRGQADPIRRQCATSVIQVGKALLEAKRHLSHGGFVRWVECEVCISVRTARDLYAGGELGVGQRRDGCAFVAVSSLPAFRLRCLRGICD